MKKKKINYVAEAREVKIKQEGTLGDAFPIPNLLLQKKIYVFAHKTAWKWLFNRTLSLNHIILLHRKTALSKDLELLPALAGRWAPP